MTVSYIVATTGRETLARTLASIETRPGDDVLVVGACPLPLQPPFWYVPCASGGDWGASERNLAMSKAHGTYLAFMDDDDIYLPGHRRLMAEAIRETPARPMIFRMQYTDPRGLVLWQSQDLRSGNVGTPMMLVPNTPAKLGVWGHTYENDAAFFSSWKWTAQDLVWRPEIIARIRPVVDEARE